MSFKSYNMHSELNYKTMTGNLIFFQKVINVKNKNVMFNWQIEFLKNVNY